MENDVKNKIRDILLRHYDYHPSLYLLSKSKNTKNEYYYESLPFESEITTFVSAANNLYLASGKRMDKFDINIYGDDEKSRFVIKLYDKKIYSNNTNKNYICLDFFRLNHLESKKTAGSLRLKYILEKEKCFNLRIVEDNLLPQYENKAGDLKSVCFYYSLNNLIRENDEIRIIIEEIFAEVLSQRSYIYKDIAEAIRDDHFFLISKELEKLEPYYNKKSYIKKEYGKRILPKINFNRYNLNSLEIICNFFEKIREKDRHLLLKMSHEEMLEFVDKKTFFQGIDIAEFVGCYYSKRFRLSNYGLVDDWARDYALMSLAKRNLISLSIRSPERLRKIHDEYQEEIKREERLEDIKKPLVVVNSRFEGLRKLLPSDFEWITTSKRLYEESDDQHNCVYIHAERIRRDLETIYHWDKDGRQYTMSFEARADGTYILTEMKARFNEYPSDEHLRYVEDLLKRPYINNHINVLHELFDNVEIV